MLFSWGAVSFFGKSGKMWQRECQEKRRRDGKHLMPLCSHSALLLPSSYLASPLHLSYSPHSLQVHMRVFRWVYSFQDKIESTSCVTYTEYSCVFVFIKMCAWTSEANECVRVLDVFWLWWCSKIHWYGDSVVVYSEKCVQDIMVKSEAFVV